MKCSQLLLRNHYAKTMYIWLSGLHVFAPYRSACGTTGDLAAASSSQERGERCPCDMVSINQKGLSFLIALWQGARAVLTAERRYAAPCVARLRREAARPRWREPLYDRCLGGDRLRLLSESVSGGVANFICRDDPREGKIDFNHDLALPGPDAAVPICWSDHCRKPSIPMR